LTLRDQAHDRSEPGFGAGTLIMSHEVGSVRE